MKKIVRGIIAITVCLSVLLGCFTFTSCQKPQDPQWSFGTDAPSDNDGLPNGSTYLDTDDYILYQKDNGKWSVICENFGKPGDVGPKGDNGENGENGTNGADGKDTKNVVKIEVNASYEIIITFDDGSTLNIGKIPGYMPCDHEYETSFAFSKCKKCGFIGRNNNINNYDLLKYDFNDEEKAEIDAHLAKFQETASGTDFVAFKEAMQDLWSDIDYVTEQTDYASIYRSIYFNDSKFRDTAHQLELYLNSLSSDGDRYLAVALRNPSLLPDICSDPFFFGDVSEEQALEEVNALLPQLDNMVNVFAGNNGACSCAYEFSNLLQSYKNGEAEITELYPCFTEFLGYLDQIAKAYGYDNYYDYAYGRYYSSEDMAKMYNYMVKYMGPLCYSMILYINELAQQLREKGIVRKKENYDFICAYYDSFFLNDPQNENYNSIINMTGLIGEYFNTLNKTSDDGTQKGIDFNALSEQLFKDGNVFTGSEAKSYCIQFDSNTACLFFGAEGTENEGTYQNVRSFLKKLGSYALRLENGQVMPDLDQLCSHANEMLFLQWVKQYEDLAYVDKEIIQYVIADQMAYQIESAIVGIMNYEFERRAYLGEITDGDYSATYEDIISDFYYPADFRDEWCDIFDHIRISASEAIGRISAFEMFINASNNYNETVDQYIKLFNYYESDASNYAEILEYAGLSDPFDEATYIALMNNISNHFGIKTEPLE